MRKLVIFRVFCRKIGVFKRADSRLSCRLGAGVFVFFYCFGVQVCVCLLRAAIKAEHNVNI